MSRHFIPYEEAETKEQADAMYTDVVEIEEVDGGWMVFTDAKDWQIWKQQK